MGKVRTRSDSGKLFLDFYYRGIRCRELTALSDTPANRRRVQRLLDRIEGEITAGRFDYAATFPESPRAVEFAGLSSTSDHLPNMGVAPGGSGTAWANPYDPDPALQSAVRTARWQVGSPQVLRQVTGICPTWPRLEQKTGQDSNFKSGYNPTSWAQMDLDEPGVTRGGQAKNLYLRDLKEINVGRYTRQELDFGGQYSIQLSYGRVGRYYSRTSQIFPRHIEHLTC